MKKTYQNLFSFFQKSTTDREQGFFGPLVEPIDSRTISDSRELTTTDTQRITDGRETQHNLELTSHTIDKEFPAVLSAINKAGCCGDKRKSR